MRNPLSAILQCADEISSSLSEFRVSDEMTKASDKINDLFDSGIDAAQTISLCGTLKDLFLSYFGDRFCSLIILEVRYGVVYEPLMVVLIYEPVLTLEFSQLNIRNASSMTS